MIGIDRTFKNEASDITSFRADDETLNRFMKNRATLLDRSVQEHLIEQLALSKEEIKRLKYELDTEKAKTDRLKDYYEGVIRGYRKMIADMNEKLKTETQRVEDMVCAISNITKVLAEK